jgi:chlorophyllide a reductase subunit Z
MPWDVEAQLLLNRLISGQPVLTQISVAKRLRDMSEREARSGNLERVTIDCVNKSKASLGVMETA